MFWVSSVYFNIRNTLPKSGTFLLGHPVYVLLYNYCNLNRVICSGSDITAISDDVLSEAGLIQIVKNFQICGVIIWRNYDKIVNP